MNPEQATAELRRQAEAALHPRTLDAPAAQSGEDMRRLVHELQVHQIELEMQNEQLLASQAQLEAATARYRDLYDFAPVGYLTLDPAGTLLDMNLTAAHLLGSERARLQGQRFGAFVAAGERPAFNTFLEQVFATEVTQSCRFALVGQGEPARTLQIEASRSLDAQECRAVAVDVTERLQMEMALAGAREAAIRYEVDQRFGALANQDIAGLAESDAAGRFSYVNDRFCAIVGRTREELLGLRTQVITHPDDRARSDELFRRLVAGGRGYLINLRYVHGDGWLVWVTMAVSVLRDTAGQPSSFTAVVLDMTERRQQEDELRRTHDLLALAERSAGVGAWYWDMVNDRFQWSDALFRLLGVDPATTPASLETWRTAVHPDDWPRIEDLMTETVRERRLFAVTYRVVLPTGAIRWIDDYGKVTCDKASGVPLHFAGICIDVTARRQAELAILESERRFRDLFVHLPVAYQSLDREGRWLDANQRMADLLGFDAPEQMLGLKFCDYAADEHRAQLVESFELFKAAGETHSELMLKRRDGRPVTVLVSGRNQRNAQGHFLRTHCILIDISERRAMEAQVLALNANLEAQVAARTAELVRVNDALRHRSRHDVLTGIHNRLAANERLHSEFVGMKRSRNPFAVVLMDVDLFKRVNDIHGHAIGDQVLARVAQILAATVRESDFVARYGGEEFLAVLPASDLAAACLVAEKLRQAVASAPDPIAGVITLSLGVALATPDQADEDAAVREADHWLYAAKNAGRNQWMAVGIG